MKNSHDLVYSYSESVSSPESALLEALSLYTITHHHGIQMLSGKIQGRFLAFVSKIISPKFILEVGTYTGYSALCLLEGLRNEGKLITLEIDPKLADTHQKFLLQSEKKEQIQVIYMDAKIFMSQFDEEVDLVFLDGAKKDYYTLYEALIPKMKKGGVMIIDNVLWKNKVLNEEQDATTQAIHALNLHILNDVRVEKFLLPLRDGLFCIMIK